jgi:hypothetical protein
MINANGATLQVVFDAIGGSLRWHRLVGLASYIRNDTIQDELVENDDKIIHTHLELQHCPGDYLELVNWSDIKLYSNQVSTDKGIGQNDPPKSSVIFSWADNSTRKSGLQHVYHMVSEEALLQEKICNRPTSMNDRSDDMDEFVVRFAIPLKESSFRADWNHYWCLWVSGLRQIFIETSVAAKLTRCIPE